MARKNRAPGGKPLFWVGSSKEDLLAFPSPVSDGVGLGTQRGAVWRKAPQRQTLEGRRRRSAGSRRGPQWRHLSSRIYGPIFSGDLGATRVPEEVDARFRDVSARQGPDRPPAEGRAARIRGALWEKRLGLR